jgi:hypothetical protein
MFSRAFNFWSARLKTHPNSTNSLFGGTVTGIGDCLAQNVEKHHSKIEELLVSKSSEKHDSTSSSSAASVNYRTTQYNYKRTAVYASLAFLVTPLWLKILKTTDKIVGANHHDQQQAQKLSSRALKFRAVKQGLLTWALGSMMVPITVSYLTATFSFFIHGISDFGEIRNRISERLHRNFLTHISGSLCFWSVHWLPMFYYLPSEWRLVYGVCANVIWQMCVSFLQHRP